MLLYSAFLFAYKLAAQILALKDPKAKKWIEGQENLLDQIESKLKGEKGFVWFHCASLGEFEQGRPLIEKIKKENPDKKILLTFFSPSGYEIRKNYSFVEQVFYLPFDTTKNVKAFLDLTKPSLAVFVKYEFWLNYFRELRYYNISLVVVSSVFRPEQIYFKWYGKAFIQALRAVSHFFVQDQRSAQLLSSHQISNVSVINDTRIDRVQQLALKAKPIPSIEVFLKKEKAFIGGSLYGTENEMLYNAWQNGLIKRKILIAPHIVDNDTIRQIRSLWGNNAILYSDLVSGKAHDGQVLIIDIIGMLASLYQYGSIALIGGGFGKGIHNTLEPAAFGMPVIFGPKYKKFTEAIEMVRRAAAFSVNDQVEFEKILSQHEKLSKASTEAKSFIMDNTGGTEMIYDWLKKHQLL